jgi:hypothetical protein
MKSTKALIGLRVSRCFCEKKSTDVLKKSPKMLPNPYIVKCNTYIYCENWKLKIAQMLPKAYSAKFSTYILL